MAYPLEGVQKRSLWSTLLPQADEDVVRRFADSLGFSGPSAEPSPRVTPGMAMAQALPVKAPKEKVKPAAEAATKLLSNPLSPLPKDSGLSTKVDDKASDQSTSTVVETKPLSSDTLAAIEAMVKDSPFYKDQAAGIDRMEELYRNQGQADNRFDLSPIIALADSETGSNLMKGYNRPISPQERLKQAAAAADKIQDDRNNLNQRALEMAKVIRGGPTLTDVLRKIAETQTQFGATAPKTPKPASPGQSGVIADRFKKAFERDMKDHIKVVNEGEQLYNDLMANNWVGDIAIPSNLARGMGAQPLSNFDLQRVKDPALIEAIRNAWSKLRSGRVTLKTRAAVEAFADVLQRAVSRKYGVALEDYATKKAKPYGIASAEEARNILGMPWLFTNYEEFKKAKANAIPPEIKALKAKLEKGEATDEEVAKVKAYLGGKK